MLEQENSSAQRRCPEVAELGGPITCGRTRNIRAEEDVNEDIRVFACGSSTPTLGPPLSIRSSHRQSRDSGTILLTR
ncbi:hypothetical protein J6590_011983 [Homalodisca vitripennis]|nr:hypothetical protein J6590_011983 [Homalodisca vitripennis]